MYTRFATTREILFLFGDDLQFANEEETREKQGDEIRAQLEGETFVRFVYAQPVENGTIGALIFFFFFFFGVRYPREDK